MHGVHQPFRQNVREAHLGAECGMHVRAGGKSLEWLCQSGTTREHYSY